MATCAEDTASITVTEDGGSGSLSWDVALAGNPATEAWPYDASPTDANGARIDPTLGNGGVWTHPPAAVTVVVAPSILYPSEGFSNIPIGTTYLDAGLPAEWEVTNPSPHLNAYGFVYAGCSIYVNGLAGAEVTVSLQTSHEGAGGPWNLRDQLRVAGGGPLITFPSLNDTFTLSFDPGEVRLVAARVKVDVAGGAYDRVERFPIKLRAIVVAAPIVV